MKHEAYRVSTRGPAAVCAAVTAINLQVETKLAESDSYQASWTSSGSDGPLSQSGASTKDERKFPWPVHGLSG